jgi:hypothetical protein
LAAAEEITGPIRIPKNTTGMVRALLIAADLLLIAMAALMAWRTPAGFGFLDVFLCSTAVALGAVLSCMALTWERQEAPTAAAEPTGSVPCKRHRATGRI